MPLFSTYRTTEHENIDIIAWCNCGSLIGQVLMDICQFEGHVEKCRLPYKGDKKAIASWGL